MDGCWVVGWLLLPLVLVVPFVLPLLSCWVAAFNACAAASRFIVVVSTAAVSSAASAGATPVVLATRVTAQSVIAVVHCFRFKGFTSFLCEG